MGDEVIRIDGDARGAVRALDSVESALDQVAAATRRLSVQDQRSQAAAKAEAAIWKARADNINATKRAAAGFAPQFSGIIDKFEEFAEGAEKVGLKSMAARAGILALGSAWTMAATLTVAAGAAIVGSAIEVITHIDSYAGHLGRHEAALREAATATSALHTEITDLRVELAGQMAPTIEGASYALAGMVDVLGDAEAGIYDITQSIGISASDIAGYIPVVRDLALAYEMLARRGRAADMEARAAAAGAAAGAGVGAAIAGGPKFNMEADVADAARAQAEADAAMLVSGATHTRAAATKAATAAHVEQRPVVDAAIQQATEYAARLQAQWEILHDLDEAERARTAGLLEQVAAVDTTVSSTIGVTQSGVDTAANAMIAGSVRVRESWQQTTTSIVATASSVLGTLSSIIGEYTDMQVGSFEEADSAQRRVLRERFRREKAAAIAMAVVQGALSVVQTLASTPYPLNIVLGVAQAAAVGVEVEMMRRQQPTYHRGGLAPDERLTYGGARVLGRETMAVYSDRRAPSQADVARAQTGERPAPDVAGPGVWSLVVDGVRERVRTFAGPSQGYDSPGRMAYGV